MTPADRRVAIRQLAPGGVIRVALNTANAATVTVTRTGVEGPAPQLVEALAEWTGLKVELTYHGSAGEVVQAAADHAWDVSCLAVDPAREALFHFTAPYLSIEIAAMVRSSSAIGSLAALDAPGVRIASSQGAAYDLILQRTLRHAVRIAFANPGASLEGFAAQKLEAVVGVRDMLLGAAAGNPDVRLLPERIAAIVHAVVVPRERPLAAALLDGFVRRWACDGDSKAVSA